VPIRRCPGDTTDVGTGEVDHDVGLPEDAGVDLAAYRVPRRLMRRLGRTSYEAYDVVTEPTELGM
jgi:hypothetical protein